LTGPGWILNRVYSFIQVITVISFVKPITIGIIITFVPNTILIIVGLGVVMCNSEYVSPPSFFRIPFIAIIAVVTYAIAIKIGPFRVVEREGILPIKVTVSIGIGN
jgi:hypothetical protein